jgi:hypothetical protein
MAGAQVVIDLANSPSFEDKAVLEFFETSGRNLLAAKAAAGVRHQVTLAIVGTDRTPENGHFRAKVAQENLIETSAIPYTIIRSTSSCNSSAPSTRHRLGLAEHRRLRAPERQMAPPALTPPNNRPTRGYDRCERGRLIVAPRPDKSSAKTKILDAALRVIRDKVCAATTVDDLCAGERCHQRCPLPPLQEQG